MHIAILTDRFSPEITAASTRLHAHARLWVEAGHQVTVVTCAPNFPRGELFADYRNAWRQAEEMDGFRVMRLWTYLAPNRGVIRRSFDIASFTVSAALQAHALRGVDVLVASSPPITVALAGALVSMRLRKPWVFEVRDLWPASIRAVGLGGAGLALRVLEAIELWLYRHAAATVVLTDPFREDLLSRGVPDDKMTVAPNGVEQGRGRARATRAEVRARLGVPQADFLVAFVGTVGLAQGAGVFVRMAERFADTPGIHFLCLGEGGARPELEAQVRASGLSNVTFHDFVPSDQMPDVLSAIDLGTVLLKADPVFDGVIPSKLIELMANGVPVAAAAGAEVKRHLTLSEAGACVAPEDDAALAACVQQLWDDAGVRDRMAAAGPDYVAHHFSREASARSILEVLGNVCRNAK